MIAPNAHVDPKAQLGNNVTVMPFAFIDADTVIGDNTVIYPYTSVMAGTTIGSGCKLYQGSIIGADPQDFRWNGRDRTTCHIGNNVTIREHVIINRSIHPDGDTFVGDDTFIMAKCHLGHDAHIDGKCVLGNGVIIAGNTRVGRCTIMSSGAMLHENCRIGDWVLVKGGCRIGSNVPPFVIMAHNPCSYFGVNAYVMGRHNAFTPEEIDDAAKAYRHLYQTGTSAFNALKRIVADVQPGRVRDAITSFIESVNLKLAALPIDMD